MNLICLLLNYQKDPNNHELFNQLKEHLLENEQEMFSIIHLKKISFQSKHTTWNETNPLYYSSYHCLNKLFDFLLPYYLSNEILLQYKEPCNILHILFLQYPKSNSLIETLFNDHKNNELLIKLLNAKDQFLVEIPLQFLMDKDLSIMQDEIKKFIFTHSTLNHQNTNGYTALHLATINYQQETVTLLLQYGANPQLQNKYNQNAYHLFDEYNICWS